jgi:murein DD-endopeptidase MepM/ murein hydrolase activator NlpD/endonuclease/exonuclease/phosphatase family metal-dependent hydrolase
MQLGVGRSMSLPHDAVGSDHGSLGIFQQQWPWWGTMRQLMDPTVSARLFYRALVRVPGWQRLPVTDAAQRVQHSAYPTAYADDQALAERLLGHAEAARPVSDTVRPAAAVDCGQAPAAGSVVYPLPAGARAVDQHNWGGRGGRWASWHTGTDLSAACGTPVLAATGGTVVVRTDQPWAGRWLVEVSTGVGQLTTWYAHMRAVSVAAGEQVRAGQQLGEVGDLGNATGCHLHFEVHPRGGSIYQDSVDPSAWLSEHVGTPSETAGGGTSAVPVSWGEGGFTLATFNTLGSSHTTARGKRPGLASGPARTRGAVALLDRYGVDVAGLQELQRPQYAALHRLAGDRYATWSPPGDTENAVAWRRDRFSLVSARTLAVPYFDGHRRRMPVVRLRDRLGGQQATFVNVHNPADTRRFPRQGHWREVAVGRERALLLRLGRSGPVFLTGDMNDRRHVYCRLTAGGLAQSATGRADRPGAGGCTPPAHPQIDWIFGTGAPGFGHYTVDRAPVRDGTSDHPFVVVRAQGAG